MVLLVTTSFCSQQTNTVHHLETDRTTRQYPSSTIYPTPGLLLQLQQFTMPSLVRRPRRRSRPKFPLNLYVLFVSILLLFSTVGVGWLYNLYDRYRLHQQNKLIQQHQRFMKHEPVTEPPELIRSTFPPGFGQLHYRAATFTKWCTELQAPTHFTGFDTRTELPFHNDTVASLPSFGITKAIEDYFGKNDETCDLPPDTECQEQQLTVVFMAYNPERLQKTLNQIKKMFSKEFMGLVKEVVMVWNGERHVDESEAGQQLLAYAHDHPVRFYYPLQQGFPNDLMNRYHPNVEPSTKAILFYDDDGPFYSAAAIQSAFELWKRHSNAQIGAMAREITITKRQLEEKYDKLGYETVSKTQARDDAFVSHCTNVNDTVDYNFRYFANYDANMVLPSGSMLHRNYLCFLWHPVFAQIRQFILDHPVHPDDMTVSLLVSQLAGKAPRVYSRRLNPPEVAATQRRLQEIATQQQQEQLLMQEQQHHRRLMFSICWDCGAGMTEMKQYWAELRTEAVNSLVRYFGSLNSGSIGWCPNHIHEYDATKDGRCHPIMAKQGQLPWMNIDGTPKEQCP